MQFYKAKTVVIITEVIILNDVVKTITELGATGYTTQRAGGKGQRGVRDESGPLTGLLQNVRIEVITSEEIAKKIAIELEEKFFKNYAGLVYIADVEIIAM